MKAKLILLILLIPIFCLGQPSYTWEEGRQPYPVQEKSTEDSLLLIKNHTQFDYVYEENNLACYQTVHKIYKVKNDEALERVNRVYISLNDVYEIVNVQARTIFPGGKMISFDSNNIKEIKDDEGGEGYKIFAIEGAEIGNEIEYVYTKKIEPKYYFNYYWQQNLPSYNNSFVLSCPNNLEYEFKAYNTSKEVELIDTSLGMRKYAIEAEYIPPLVEEEFTSNDNFRQRIGFKLAYNSANSSRRLLTWNDAAQRINDLFLPFEKEEKKHLQKELKNVEIPNNVNENIKAIMIEAYIKDNYTIQENVGRQGEILDLIIKNKLSSSRGLTRLLYGLFNEAGIESNIVITTSREGVWLDGQFDSWAGLNDYFLYIPSMDSFVSPSHPEYRIGLLPAEFTGIDALLIDYVEMQDIKMPVGKIIEIPAIDYKKNFDNLDIKISFTDDLEQNLVDLKRSFKGYSGVYLKYYYPRVDEETRSTIVSDIIKYQAEDAEVLSSGVLSEDFELVKKDDPFTVECQFKTRSYIENADDIILFNVGKSIGAQTEMYQETERVMPVVNQYNRGYFRQIIVDLPKGYTVENPDDLIIDKSAVGDNGEVVYLFKSSYELVGSELKISIDEYYNQILFPADRYVEFQEVINAAADWNKVVLVLSKG